VRDQFIRRLSALAADDPRLMLLTADLGFGVLTDFAKRFPRQFLNVGVAEQNMTGLATGLALEGRVVFTYSIANFPTLRCLEQVRNDAAYHEANVKITAIGGGFSYGALGMSHHATEDLAILRSLPITVVAPGCDWEATEATTAIARQPGTCYLRLDRSSVASTQRPGETFELGKARVLRDGTDLTIIAVGGILGAALEAADRLSAQGVEARVMSIHTLRPFDRAAVVDASRATGGILTVEEHTIHGGLGSAVAEACLDGGAAPRTFYRVGLREGFTTHVGSQEYLRRQYGIDSSAIEGAALRMVSSARTGNSRPPD
jgi:transketolase